jgi:hypothetical protein
VDALAQNLTDEEALMSKTGSLAFSSMHVEVNSGKSRRCLKFSFPQKSPT